MNELKKHILECRKRDQGYREKDPEHYPPSNDQLDQWDDKFLNDQITEDIYREGLAMMMEKTKSDLESLIDKSHRLLRHFL